MTTATAPAVEKRKKPWTKARVIDLIIDIFCFVIVGAASLTCILPFIHILAKSLSDNAYVVANRVILLPMSDAGINLDAYNKVFHDPTIMQSLWVTALVTGCVYSNRYVSYGLCLLCADPPGIPWPQGVHLYDHVHDVLYRRYDP